jgi:hypothetical protein
MKNFKVDKMVKVKKIVKHRPYSHANIAARIKIGEIGKIKEVISYHMINVTFYLKYYSRTRRYFRNSEIMFRSELTDANDEEKERFLEREEICIAKEVARGL